LNKQWSAKNSAYSQQTANKQYNTATYKKATGEKAARILTVTNLLDLIAREEGNIT